MPVEPIPFGETQATGLEQLAGASPLSANAMTDGTGTVRQRPGIATWTDFPSTIPNASAVVGMVPWGDYLVYITEDRNIYAWFGSGLVAALSDGTTATMLDGTERPVLLPLRTKVVIAGGGEPQKWEGVGFSARIGGSPPRMRHVAGIATRIAGTPADVSGRIVWSGLGDSGHEDWDAYNYTEAEAKHDPLAALWDNTNELFAFGTETLQVFSPDPLLGFATSRAVNIGLGAPHSVIRADDTFVCLDRYRRFLATDGRGFEDVSSQLLKRSLDAYSEVSDAFGARMQLDGWDACVTFFPTVGKGLIWERNANRWSEWRAWGSSGWAAPAITSAVHWPEKNLYLVGLSTGQIARLDTSTYSDLGQPLKVELVTGFQSRGTNAHKHCQAVRFVFKRGIGSYGATAPQVAVSWRDDLGAFCRQTAFSLGAAGDYDPVVEIRSAGRYRQRQWKLEFDSAAELSFVGAEETFEVMAA